MTHLENFETCETEEGVFGLAFSMISSHNYPSILKNMESTLLHPMFSLYLDATDDYPEDQVLHDIAPDSNGNIEYGRARPISATSQIVFGGVDQTHYEGCLNWHQLGVFDYSQDPSYAKFAQNSGFWDLKLDDVRVGGTSVVTAHLALVDSGSSYIVGPLQDVGQIALLNEATCFVLEDPNDPQFVPCDNEDGFDAAVIQCDQPFFSIEFVMDGTTYVLEKEDLIIDIVSPALDACILRLIGSKEIPVSCKLVAS